MKTTDVSDAHGDARSLAPILRSFGGAREVHGRITTLKVHEDNALVRKALEEKGEGRVLLVDGGGSMRCALVGDNLAALALANGWAGIVVYGCIRDSAAIASIAVGVFAMATHPKKSVKRGEGQRDVPVTFGGVTFAPGEWICADDDGVIVMSDPPR